MTSRRLVLDANILIRAVLGSRVPALIAAYAGDIEFVAPTMAFEEAGRYLPTLAAARGADPADWRGALAALRVVVVPLDETLLEPRRAAALARIGNRDADDWPAVAASLVLGCPVWTEDRDFFGSGVPTWTTDRVEVYLRGD